MNTFERDVRVALGEMSDGHLHELMGHLQKLRGPGVVDPDLPVDPDNEKFPQPVKDWANANMAAIAEERDRRRTLR